jgi:excinuclease UvrABC nuclease subunit
MKTQHARLIEIKGRRIEFRIRHPSGWLDELRAEAGERPGVYLAYHDDTIVYVGKASRMNERLMQHHRSWLSISTQMFPTHFIVIDTPTVIDAEALESDMILSLRPPLNRKTETSCSDFMMWLLCQQHREDEDIGVLAQDLAQDLRVREAHGKAPYRTIEELSSEISMRGCQEAKQAIRTAFNQYRVARKRMARNMN